MKSLSLFFNVQIIMCYNIQLKTNFSTFTFGVKKKGFRFQFCQTSGASLEIKQLAGVTSTCFLLGGHTTDQKHFWSKGGWVRETYRIRVGVKVHIKSVCMSPYPPTWFIELVPLCRVHPVPDDINDDDENMYNTLGRLTGIKVPQNEIFFNKKSLGILVFIWHRQIIIFQK